MIIIFANIGHCAMSVIFVYAHNSLFFSVPIGCSLFPQKSSMQFNSLEKTVQEKIRSQCITLPDRVYFNKGL